MCVPPRLDTPVCEQGGEAVTDYPMTYTNLHFEEEDALHAWTGFVGNKAGFGKSVRSVAQNLDPSKVKHVFVRLPSLASVFHTSPKEAGAASVSILALGSSISSQWPTLFEHTRTMQQDAGHRSELFTAATTWSSTIDTSISSNVVSSTCGEMVHQELMSVDAPTDSFDGGGAGMNAAAGAAEDGVVVSQDHTDELPLQSIPALGTVRNKMNLATFLAGPLKQMVDQRTPEGEESSTVEVEFALSGPLTLDVTFGTRPGNVFGKNARWFLSVGYGYLGIEWDDVKPEVNVVLLMRRNTRGVDLPDRIRATELLRVADEVAALCGKTKVCLQDSAVRLFPRRITNEQILAFLNRDRPFGSGQLPRLHSPWARQQKVDSAIVEVPYVVVSLSHGTTSLYAALGYRRKSDASASNAADDLEAYAERKLVDLLRMRVQRGGRQKLLKTEERVAGEWTVRDAAKHVITTLKKEPTDVREFVEAYLLMLALATICPQNRKGNRTLCKHVSSASTDAADTLLNDVAGQAAEFHDGTRSDRRMVDESSHEVPSPSSLCYIVATDSLSRGCGPVKSGYEALKSMLWHYVNDRRKTPIAAGVLERYVRIVVPVTPNQQNELDCGIQVATNLEKIARAVCDDKDRIWHNLYCAKHTSSLRTLFNIDANTPQQMQKKRRTLYDEILSGTASSSVVKGRTDQAPLSGNPGNPDVVVHEYCRNEVNFLGARFPVSERDLLLIYPHTEEDMPDRDALKGNKREQSEAVDDWLCEMNWFNDVAVNISLLSWLRRHLPSDGVFGFNVGFFDKCKPSMLWRDYVLNVKGMFKHVDLLKKHVVVIPKHVGSNHWQGFAILNSCALAWLCDHTEESAQERNQKKAAARKEQARFRDPLHTRATRSQKRPRDNGRIIELSDDDEPN